MIQEKKTTGKFASLQGLCLLFLCMIFCLLADMSVEAATNGDWEYKVLEDGTAEITGYSGKATKIVIPSMIAEKSVTSIGWSAFEDCSSLTSITIPDSVTVIGYFAFEGCSSLTNINIPDSVTVIGESIFHDCSSLTSINIPNSVTIIGYSAFEGCSSLTTINIPSSVTVIGSYAFKGCNRLTSINIPSSVTMIGYSTFEGCNRLTTINIPNSVTFIGSYAFYDCSRLTSINVAENSQSYASKDGILYNKSLTNLLCCPAGKQGTITIPSSVTVIEYSAFENCSRLNSINIPSSVTVIGESAFEGCSSGLIIYGESSSYAAKYAKKYKIKFICLRHTYQKTTKKATTKKNGAIITKCSVCGDIKSTTTICAASKIKLSKTSFTYNGKNQKPTITVKDSKGNKLPAGSYKVTYPKTSKNVGEYTVTVTLQGNYSGTVKLTYQIVPKTTSISKLTAKKKGFTVKWKKQTSQTTGYQIQYSTSSKFKGAKTVTVKKNKTVSQSITKLKAGKKYYVRIRTYKTVKIKGKSVKLYSGWSKTKSVRTKK